MQAMRATTKPSRLVPARRASMPDEDDPDDRARRIEAITARVWSEMPDDERRDIDYDTMPPAPPGWLF